MEEGGGSWKCLQRILFSSNGGATPDQWLDLGGAQEQNPHLIRSPTGQQQKSGGQWYNQHSTTPCPTGRPHQLSNSEPPEATVILKYEETEPTKWIPTSSKMA